MAHVGLVLLFTLGAAAGAQTGSSPLSYVFSSHMVLQRDGTGARLFGTVPPCERVTLSLDGATVASASADPATGAWEATLPPQPASVNRTLVVRSATSAEQTLTDVAFGDVFLCGGQSNMAFALHNAFNGTAEAAGAASGAAGVDVRVLDNGVMWPVCARGVGVASSVRLSCHRTTPGGLAHDDGWGATAPLLTHSGPTKR